MIFVGIGIGVLLGVLFTTWAHGVEPAPERPCSDCPSDDVH